MNFTCESRENLRKIAFRAYKKRNPGLNFNYGLKKQWANFMGDNLFCGFVAVTLPAICENRVSARVAVLAALPGLRKFPIFKGIFEKIQFERIF